MSKLSTITRSEYEKALKRLPEPVGPGLLLVHEFLAPLGITQLRFAQAIGVSPAYVTDIVKGRRGITAEMALRFELALGMPARFWLNAQTSVDIYRAQNNKAEAEKRKKIEHLVVA